MLTPAQLTRNRATPQLHSLQPPSGLGLQPITPCDETPAVPLCKAVSTVTHGSLQLLTHNQHRAEQREVSHAEPRSSRRWSLSAF